MRRGALTLALAFSVAQPLRLRAEPTTAAFLKIPVGARAVAMGGAYTALAEGAESLYWNPAGMASLPGRQLGATHTELFEGIRYDFLGYVHPTPVGFIGTSLAFLSQAGIEGRGENREPTGDFGASDTAFTLAYGRILPGLPVRVGTSFKFLESRIGSDAARTFAMDFGSIYRLSRQAPVTLGIAVRNLGPGMRFESERFNLPMSFSSGLAYHWRAGIALALDVQHRPYESKTSLGVGTEYAILPALSLRAGYSQSGTGPATSSPSSFGGMRGLGAGLGIKVSNYRFDYALTPLGELGDAQRVSLNARW